uniref:DNA primase small subunit n=1 Tax=Pseudictyota dubia TaxID=2749911 RepID=A0A7R9YXY9_9STRA
MGSLPEGARPVADRLKKKWGNDRGDAYDTSPEEKWEELKRNLDILVGKNAGNKSGNNKAAKKLSTKDRIQIEQFPTKTVFKYCYPRLDINVSKMQNHLLKSPFCVHPKTGRVCVPMDPAKADDFDPFDVPTLPRLMRELDEYNKKQQSQEESADNKEEKAGVTHEWQKTSLREPFEAFRRQFLTPMWQDLRRERRERAEEAAAATGDF